MGENFLNLWKNTNILIQKSNKVEKITRSINRFTIENNAEKQRQNLEDIKKNDLSLKRDCQYNLQMTGNQKKWKQKGRIIIY